MFQNGQYVRFKTVSEVPVVVLCRVGDILIGHGGICLHITPVLGLITVVFLFLIVLFVLLLNGLYDLKINTILLHFVEKGLPANFE